MLATLFRSKFDLERALAVERCRREIGERDAQFWRARCERVELEHRRLIDETLLKQGAIRTPLRTEPSPPANPLASMIGALGVSEIDGKPSTFGEIELLRERDPFRNANILSKPTMSDS